MIKFVMAFVVISIMWCFNRYMKNKLEKKNKTNEVEYRIGFLSSLEIYDSLEKSNLGVLKTINKLIVSPGNTRVFQAIKDEKVIASILYAWPSGLWSYRMSQDELDLNSYSHILYIEVDPEFRNKGYARELIFEVIEDTKNISSGLTLLANTEDDKKLFSEHFGFTEYKDNTMIIEY